MGDFSDGCVLLFCQVEATAIKITSLKSLRSMSFSPYFKYSGKPPASIYCARLLLIFTCSSVIYSHSKFSFNPIFLNFKNSLHVKSSDIFLSHPDFLALFPCPSLLVLSSVEQLSPRSCSHSLQEPQERLLGAHPQCVKMGIRSEDVSLVYSIPFVLYSNTF